MKSFDADDLHQLQRGGEGMGDRVRIIDTDWPGRIGASHHRLPLLELAELAENLSR